MTRIILALTFLVILSVALPARAETLSFSTADDQTHPRALASNTVVVECFRRLGMSITINSMPSKRSLHTANEGEADGNFLRTRGITEAYPNLLLVPEPIAVNRIVAFSKNRDIIVNGWKSLLPYHMAWVRGWRNCERELKDAAKITQVNNETILFRFLNDGRADAGIFGMETGLTILKRLGITDVVPLKPPVAESGLFISLHKKHAALIPRVAQTPRDMKKDGGFMEIQNRFGRAEQYK